MIRLVKADVSAFEACYGLIEQNFVREERRDREAARAAWRDPHFCAYRVTDGAAAVGLVTVWTVGAFAMIEHFVMTEGVRGRGYGAQVLDLLKARYGTLVLECEKPDTAMRCRRVAFYERNGFCRNAIDYAQPAYRKGESDVPMLLLSYPQPLSDAQEAARAIARVVYGKGEER